jgi:ATP-dependent helicase/nuclease subunit B
MKEHAAFSSDVEGAGSPPFLARLASDLYGGAFGPIEDVLIILPGKRARLFLNKALAACASVPLWAPVVYTMEEFVFDVLGNEPADEVEQVLALWEVCRNTGDFKPTFEQLSGWASTVLRDFNDVDLFLAPPDQVFVNLLDTRKMQLWSPGEEGVSMSEFEELYIAFYNHLLGWYQALRDHLLASGRCYQGQAFRMVAEDVDLLMAHCRGKHVVFAGFNAFTPAEERIISVLDRAGRASLRWDADRWYIDQKIQEAGHFIRQWRRSHPDRNFQWLSDDLVGTEKQVSVYGVHGNRAQARLAGEILSGVTDVSPGTAVVLSDELLLLPLLNAMPANINHFNVTMGLSFRQTPALSWLMLNLRMADAAPRWIRVASLIPVLRHPWFAVLTDSDMVENSGALVDPVTLIKKRFYPADALIGILVKNYPHCASVLREWITPPTDAADWIMKMIKILRVLMHKMPAASHPFDRGAAIEAIRLLMLARGALTPTASKEEGFSMLKYFLSRLVNAASIPFTGEPLEGVQVLGLLETRNLDFNHVILLSANERILPSGRKPNTLIPADLRRHFGLPGVQHQDAIFAYHFLHLLQRASKIDIIYNTDLSSDNAGELSRFIRQLEAELIPANPNITWQHHKLSNEMHKGEIVPPLAVEKEDTVFESLVYQLGNRGLSPSQLSRYIRCPLMFYFSFVASLEEAVSFEESLDLKELGNLVHGTLQQLYKPGVRQQENSLARPLSRDFFASALPRVREMVFANMREMVFANTGEEVGSDDEISGRNLIIAEVAEFMVRRFLENEQMEIEAHEIIVLGVEQGLSLMLNVPVVAHGSGTEGSTDAVELVPVVFKGVADRIDRYDGAVRITDYKTGRVEIKNLKYSNVEQLFEDPGCEKALQLLSYCWLYDRTQGKGAAVSSGIFTLKNPSSFFLPLPPPTDQPTATPNDLLEMFEEAVTKIVAEMLDRKIPFMQTNDMDICKRCPYLSICRTDLITPQ